MKLAIDANELTLGEIEFFEDQSGLTFDDLSEGRMNTRGLMALLVLTERKGGNGAFSMDDARALKLGEIEVEVVDPTGAPGAPSPALPDEASD